MVIMNNLYLLFAHYIGDYVFQSDFLANTKSKSFYNLFVHCFLYSMTICITFVLLKGTFYMYQFIILLSSHMVIDFIKSNAKNKNKQLTTYLYIDQFLHIVINLSLYITM